jgi:hypothetical protein
LEREPPFRERLSPTNQPAVTGILSLPAYVLTMRAAKARDWERTVTASPREDTRMHQPQRHTRARSLALAALAIATVSLAGPARAQTYDPAYPVCLQIYQGGIADYYFECAYTSIPQCQASASGRAAQCVVNPYYGKGKPAPRKKRVRTY